MGPHKTGANSLPRGRAGDSAVHNQNLGAVSGGTLRGGAAAAAAAAHNEVVGGARGGHGKIMAALITPLAIAHSSLLVPPPRNAIDKSLAPWRGGSRGDGQFGDGTARVATSARGSLTPHADSWGCNCINATRDGLTSCDGRPPSPRPPGATEAPAHHRRQSVKLACGSATGAPSAAPRAMAGRTSRPTPGCQSGARTRRPTPR